MQIRISRIRGSNAMTYGDFDFIVDEHRVYQLIGKNGSGKSSLPVILEEILFNSNSRGIAKAEIPHMFTDIKGWWGEVTFFVEEDKYIVRKDVKSTAKLKLTKNGEDISGHTATQTYKLLGQILGLDFKTFSKLVYQSMDSSLDFLTATDANRKKFLISLLGLEQYAEVEASLKEALKEAKSEADDIEKRHKQITSWINKSRIIPDEQQVQEVPEEDAESQETLAIKQQELGGLVAENKRVDEHNAKIAEYNRLEARGEALRSQLDEVEKNKPAPVDDNSSAVQIITRELTQVQTQMASHKANYKRFKEDAAKTSCPTCGSHLDVRHQEMARDTAAEEFTKLKPLRDQLQKDLDEATVAQQAATLFSNWQRQFERASAQLTSFKETIDSMGEIDLEPKCKTDAISLEVEIKDLRKQITARKVLIQETIDANNSAIAANAARKEQVQNLRDYQEELEGIRAKLDDALEKVGDIAILAEAFGSKGIVGYKIESSIKVFEDLINKYLSYFAAGQFALSFELDGAKLKVVIYSNSKQMGMKSLSSGEKSAVTISTLLAIRSLMSSISKVNLNLLFLDEVISVLDDDRRDLLIDLLLEEYDLNSFLVSHGYNHPLTKDIRLEKTDNVSRVVNG